MFITGADAANPEKYALEALKTLLIAKLGAAPHAQTFAPYGGILVTCDPSEAEKWLAASKRPVLFLEADETSAKPDEDAQWGTAIDGKTVNGTRWLMEIPIECVISTFSAPAEKPLVSALHLAINGALDELDALALEESEIRPGQGRKTKEGRVNPHVFSCALHAVL